MKHKHTLALLTSASLSMACCLQLTESFSAPEATAAQPETVTAAVPAAATDSRINSVTFTPIDKNGKIFANVDLDITERGQLIVCIYTRTNAFADGNAAQQMCGIGASASEKTNTIIAPGTKTVSLEMNGSIPEHYTVRAFLITPEGKPLSMVYEQDRDREMPKDPVIPEETEDSEEPEESIDLSSMAKSTDYNWYFGNFDPKKNPGLYQVVYKYYESENPNPNYRDLLKEETASSAKVIEILSIPHERVAELDAPESKKNEINKLNESIKNVFFSTQPRVSSDQKVPPLPKGAFCNVKFIEFPENIKRISDFGYEKTSDTGFRSLLRADMPEGVETILDNAFLNCPSLRTVTMPNSVYKIGTDVFSGCEKLRNVTLPENSVLTALPEFMFNGCTSLSEISIPKTYTTIGKSCFQNAGLRKLELPDSITTIESNAFSGCNYLQEVTIPDSVTALGKNAFAECKALKRIKLPENDKLTILPTELFKGCSALTSVELPDTLKGINVDCFADSGMVEITIPEKAKDVKVTNGSFPHNYFTVYGYGKTQMNGTEEKTNVKKLYEQPTTYKYAFVELDHAAETETFTDLIPNTVYNFYRYSGSSGFYGRDKLLYVAQGVSDKNGCLTVTYRPNTISSNSHNSDVICYETTAKPEATKSAAESTVYGDITCDGVVDVSDAVLLARFLVSDSEAKITDQGLRNADTDLDNDATAEDLILILKKIAKLVTLPFTEKQTA